MQLKTKTELQTGTNELSQRKNCVLNQHTLSYRQKEKSQCNSKLKQSAHQTRAGQGTHRLSQKKNYG